jgi:hypothetical protein
MDLASKTYYKLAQQTEAELDKEQNPQKQKELRKVAGQNYFYSAMEAIEWKLKKAGIDLYSINSHHERLIVVKKNSNQFSDPINLILKFEIMINYDYRRKITYKGENSNKFITLKELAQICQKEIADET